MIGLIATAWMLNKFVPAVSERVVSSTLRQLRTGRAAAFDPSDARATSTTPYDVEFGELSESIALYLTEDHVRGDRRARYARMRERCALQRCPPLPTLRKTLRGRVKELEP